MDLLKPFALTFLLLFPLFGYSQNLYVRTFGQTSDPAILFLHGGPGYNAASFEISTALPLAKAGFFVIVYDRRGEGRSLDYKAKFTFEQSCQDINALLDSFHIRQINLLGHSFGGMLAIEYAKKFSERVHSLVLVSAPIDLQESFRTIIASCKKIYEDKSDTTGLKYLSMLEAMDTTSLGYSSYSFMHAMSNGFYTPDSLSEAAKAIYQSIGVDTLGKYAAQMTYSPPQGFWKNEHYTTLNLSGDLRRIIEKGIPVYGIYGEEDGLYSEKQLHGLGEILGEDRLMVLKNCSHSVFIDRQKRFIELILLAVNLEDFGSD